MADQYRSKHYPFVINSTIQMDQPALWHVMCRACGDQRPADLGTYHDHSQAQNAMAYHANQMN